MRKLLFAFFMGAFSILAISQPVKNKKHKSSKKTWTKGGIFALSVAQGGSSNWAAGAEKFSLSVNGYANLFANKKWGKNTWDNKLDVSYGLINSTTQGLRKNDDRIDFTTTYTRALNNKKVKNLSFALLANFRAQFAEGYDYGVAPRKRISGFFAPAYLTLAPGLQYKPIPSLSIFLTPLAGRVVAFTNRPYSYQYDGGIKPDGGTEIPLSSQYGVDPRRQVDMQLGSYLSVNYKKEFAKNISYRGKFDVYADYLSNKALNMDLYFTNALILNVNKWLHVSYNLDVIYDDDIKQFGANKTSPGTQFRSLLGIGINTKF